MVHQLTIHVLDTGVFLTNWVQKNPDIHLLTTPSVLTEIENRPSLQRVEHLFSTGRLKEEAPDSVMISKVQEAAQQTGDISVLSEIDIEVLAVGLGRKNAGETVVLVSTDLSLLNTAVHLGLDVLDPNKKMKQKIDWILRCPGCGHIERERVSDNECPTCGTTMQRKPNKRKGIGKGR